ncbi:hypothetical protein OKW98_22210 [Pseudomonas sp. KU26590]|nr:hypothetical protein [Pseudomonas sp. KU26590]UZJ59241.1 hypothetical protein OKW98_22210 [Pseudomonas sp. KU26590]
MMMDLAALLSPHTLSLFKSAEQNQNRIDLLASFKIMQNAQHVPDASEQE